MYSTNLIKAIQTKVNSASTSEEVFYLSEAIRKLNLGVVKTVVTYADLQTFNAKNGDVVFVEDEEALYFSVLGVGWVKIFSVGVLSAFGWGLGSFGRLGDNNATNRSLPVSVVGGFTDWIQVVGGSAHSLGLRENGTAWGWGRSFYGVMGDGVGASSWSSPVAVVGGFTDWIQLSTRGNHSLGLRANGTAWSWGNNQYGVLGGGVVGGNRNSPESVVGGFTDWSQLSGGSLHSLGLRSNSTAWAWGLNTSGQLGDNSTTSRASPVSIVGGFTDWIQLSAGGRHSIGLRVNGTTWAWGNNIDGQLGDNSTTVRSSPVSVVGGFTDWVQVSAGFSHSLGLRSNGTAWAWGLNTNGQLGDNSTTGKSSPVSVVGGFTDWVQLDGGGAHSLALRANGTIWSWGNGAYGKLGDNTAVGKSSPVSVIDGAVGWVQVSANPNHNTGVRAG